MKCVLEHTHILLLAISVMYKTKTNVYHLNMNLIYAICFLLNVIFNSKIILVT